MIFGKERLLLIMFNMSLVTEQIHKRQIVRRNI